MALTDAKLRSLKGAETIRKFSDGGGLHVVVTTGGSRLWRLAYTPFGTIKAWMGHTHFLMKRLKNVRTEISLHILAYNLKRVMQILGTGPLIAAIRT